MSILKDEILTGRLHGMVHEMHDLLREVRWHSPGNLPKDLTTRIDKLLADTERYLDKVE